MATILLRARAEFMPYAPSAHSPSEVRVWVRSHLIVSGGVTVAEYARSIVGLIAVSDGADGSWIEQLAVAPEHIGCGIGSALLQRAMAGLVPPTRLYTFQANVAAQRFYERHGFVAIGFTDGRANEERCPDVLYECRPCGTLGHKHFTSGL